MIGQRVLTTLLLTVIALVALGAPSAGSSDQSIESEVGFAEDLAAASIGSSLSDILDIAEVAVSHRAEGLLAEGTDTAPAFQQELSSLSTGRELLDILDSSEDPLLRATSAAWVASHHQAKTLGLGLLPWNPGVASSLADMVFAVASRHDLPLADDQEQEVATILDGLDDEGRAALAAVLQAYLEFDGAARELQSESISQSGLVPAPRSLGNLITARAALAESSKALRDAFNGLPESQSVLSPPLVDLCPVVAIDPVGDNTLYPADCALIIDVGGNDTYANNAGGSDYLFAGCDFGVASLGAAAVIDLAGDDHYGSLARGCGVNGGGFSRGSGDLTTAPGVGFLLDAQGNDTYSSGGRGTNGGGYGYAGVGLGFLLDAAGDDVYISTEIGTNGGGAGIGTPHFLAQGDDDPNAPRYGLGAGFLIDGEGDDVYVATSQGTNGGGSSIMGAGHGLLVDGNGSDDYSSTYEGTNGGAYGVSTAFGLYTSSGSGYGNLLATGFLVDAARGCVPSPVDFGATYRATG